MHVHTLTMAPVPKAPDRKSRLQEFVDWAAAHISGDEKGEADRILLVDRPTEDPDCIAKFNQRN